MKLRDLINIGPKLEQELKFHGIESLDELIERGSLKTFILLVGEDGEGCYNKLYALEGAIQGIRWHEIERKKLHELREQYKRYIQR